MSEATIASTPQPPSTRSVGTRMTADLTCSSRQGRKSHGNYHNTYDQAPDISTNITLITTRTDHSSGHTTFVYSVDCMKYKSLQLTLDFMGVQI